MYAGAGSSPLVAAASVWNKLAGELSSAAIGYEAIITGLTNEDWLGPASASMAQAVTPYVEWMNTVAAQAEQAAARARQAASAYETALAATVHPADVDANRTQLSSLVSTNVLGQNTLAIAVTEADYGEMWARDTAAMYGYAGESASASRVTPFSTPDPATADGTQGGQLVSAAQAALASLTSPASAAGSSTSPLDSILGDLYALLGLKYTPGSPIGNALAPWTSYIGPAQSSIAIAHFSTGAVNSGVALSKALAPATAAAKAAGDGAKAAAGALPAALPAAGLGAQLGGAAPVAAGLGNAAAAGRLSVPASWTAGPAAGSVAPTAVSTVAAISPDVEEPGSLMGGMPMAGAAAGARGSGPRYGFRPKVMARPFAAG